MSACLRDYARDRLRSLNWLQVQGDAPDKGAIFSMTMDGAHAHDISTILDKRGIAVRAGTHCAMPLMDFYGVTATARASFGMYNTQGRGRRPDRRPAILPRAFRLMPIAAAAHCGRRDCGYAVAAQAPVAQLDRALPSEGRGHTFESCRDFIPAPTGI
jgi:hypothetical protein